jgi:peroxiredoxin/mono/diheme cytochrome c family protein
MLYRLAVSALVLVGAAVAHAADVPLGRTVADFQLQDFRGKKHALADYRDSKLVVLAVTGTECPLAKRYGPRLAKLAEAYQPRGVSFLGIDANVQDSIAELAAYARVSGINFPLLRDLGNQVADAIGAVRTPTVFVLDENRVVRYWGRIDDQYGVGYVRDEPQKHDLQTALDELLAGKEVTTPETEAVGCFIGRAKQPRNDSPVTYSNQVARIFQNRCVECHREGEIAPFALTDYEEVVGWADMIQEVVREGRMPPWHANEKGGPFENCQQLTKEEKDAIYAWVRAGAPEGNPKDLPESRNWVTGWQLPREADYVAPLADSPFRVPAEGAVRYQYFQVDPGFADDKWVSSVEIQPGNRAVVHHVLMFVKAPGDDGRQFHGGANGYDGIFVPGQRVQPYPAGMARRIEAGSQLVFQVHYTPIGTEQLDQSRVGILFVDPQSIEYEVRTASAVNSDLRIPPHEANYRGEAASPPLPANARLLALNPHMHLRGKSFFYEAILPSGERKTLLEVPRYDFNWQTAYRHAEPLELPEGTRLHCVAHFDNSADNLNNPDPTKTVRWGEQTWDEMLIGYYDYVVPVATKTGPSKTDRSKKRIQELFARVDKNADGKVLAEEVPEKYRWLFKPLDRDNDGVLSEEEFSGVMFLGPLQKR